MNRFRPPPCARKLLLGGLLSLAPFVSQAADNDALGPLFFTPEQRDIVDGLVQPKPSQATEVPEQELPPVARYNGSVQRSGGRSTAWVDGIRLEGIDQHRAGVELKLSGRRLAVRDAQGVKLVEPGQTVPDLDARPKISRPTAGSND